MTRNVLKPGLVTVCKHMESGDWRDQQKNVIHEEFSEQRGKCLFSGGDGKNDLRKKSKYIPAKDE